MFLRYLKVYNNGENTNLSCLEVLGEGEEAGLPIVVVVGQLKYYRIKQPVLSRGAWR
jgi:hypothetical protein